MALSFTLVDRPQSSWLQFVIQAVAAPFLSELLAFACILVAFTFTESLLQMGDVTFGALVAGVGFMLGVAAGRVVPDLIKSGRWIWIFAVALFALAVIGELATVPSYPGHSRERVLREPFTGHGEGFTFIFLTVPTCASITYSLGMFVAQRWERARRQ